jgi:hypothetical protein
MFTWEFALPLSSVLLRLQKLISTFLSALSAVCWPINAASEPEIIVEVDSAVGVDAYLRKMGFYNIDNHPERLQAVPRTRIVRIPDSPKDVWRENTPLRKSVFFRLGLPAVLQVNEEILADRNRLLGITLADNSKIMRDIGDR